MHVIVIIVMVVIRRGVVAIVYLSYRIIELLWSVSRIAASRPRGPLNSHAKLLLPTLAAAATTSLARTSTSTSSSADDYDRPLDSSNGPAS